jgi:hypothetical protein
VPGQLHVQLQYTLYNLFLEVLLHCHSTQVERLHTRRRTRTARVCSHVFGHAMQCMLLPVNSVGLTYPANCTLYVSKHMLTWPNFALWHTNTLLTASRHVVRGQMPSSTDCEFLHCEFLHCDVLYL